MGGDDLVEVIPDDFPITLKELAITVIMAIWVIVDGNTVVDNSISVTLLSREECGICRFIIALVKTNPSGQFTFKNVNRVL